MGVSAQVRGMVPCKACAFGITSACVSAGVKAEDDPLVVKMPPAHATSQPVSPHAQGAVAPWHPRAEMSIEARESKCGARRFYPAATGVAVRV